MPRRPVIPAELTSGPFTVADARRAGLTRGHLTGPTWRRLAPGTYVWKGIPDGPALRLEALSRLLPSTAAFSGLTAAWCHGLDVPPDEPIDVTISGSGGGWSWAGVVVRRNVLDGHEIVVRRGLRVTSMARTLYDLVRRVGLVEAVVVADMAFHSGVIDLVELTTFVAAQSGRKGVAAARPLLDLVEPAAESPMESRLRMLLVLGGLPRPQAQVSLHADDGEFLGRADLYYPDCRLAMEYDGETHRSSLVDDNRRQNRLLSAGFRLLRFTAADVLRSPGAVLTQVRTALAGG